jgi:type IV pilus assembly protein PilB
MDMNQKQNRLGEILHEQGLISASQLKVALATAESRPGRPLGKVLIQAGLITEEGLAKALARQKGLKIVNLDDYEINPQAVSRISESLAKRCKVLPIDLKGDSLIVATANPLDIQALDSVRLVTGLKVEPVIATETSIEQAISNYLSGPSQIKETVDAAKTDWGPEVADDPEMLFDADAPVVKLANTILSLAARQRASDVHIECEESLVRVRYRVDGVLRETMTLPKRLSRLLVSRVKIMSGMDIAERRRPQDGRATITVGNQEVQIRAASLPGVHGENVTLRLINGNNVLFGLEDLGFDQPLMDLYRDSFNRSFGAIINTGPTGSGKTTSLYATLAELNTPAKKIITIEDPVEYPLEGLTQLQVNRKAGLDFAAGLRAILRADPDVVMIGEIRDIETARIAMRAALTGHLVLSSLHTQDAAGAVTRLLDMGLDPFLVTSSIRCVLAQRLARLLCPHCKEPAKYSAADLKRLGVGAVAGESTFYRPGGCRRCQKTGYLGRLGIYELLVLSEPLSKLCAQGASSQKIKAAAVKEGMRTLFEDGIIKARQGLVSIEEVRRVVL